MKNILITGTSSGIGKAAAKVFTNKGYRVFGTVRKEEDGRILKSELGDNFAPIIMDVTNGASVRSAANRVESLIAKSGLRALINNAGVAVAGPLMHVSAEDLRYQFEVNVIGVMEVTKAFLPLLGAQEYPLFKPGKIINVSSAVGKVAFPFLGPYVGSKHALEGLSSSLRKELRLYGIDVILVGPGAVKTPIWDKEAATDVSAFENTHYISSGKKFQKGFVKMGKEGHDPEKIGKLFLKIVEKKKPKTRYAVLAHPVKEWYLPRMLPTRMFDNMLGKQLGLNRMKWD